MKLKLPSLISKDQLIRLTEIQKDNEPQAGVDPGFLRWGSTLMERLIPHYLVKNRE